MRPTALLFFLLLAALLPAQRDATLTVKAQGCPTPPRVFTFTGAGFAVVDTLAQTAPGEYRATLSLEEPVFRYVGGSPGDALPVILGGGEAVTVSATCGRFRQGTVTDSPINTAYAALKRDFDTFNERFQMLQQDIEVIRDARVNAEGREMMRELDAKKSALIDRLQGVYPLLGRIAALNTYVSWYSADTTAYQGPLDHYITTFFDRVDFTDPGYNDLSWTYESARNYTQTLAAAIPDARLGDVLLAETSRWPAGSRARFLARSGALASLLSIKHPAASALANATIEEFAPLFPEPVAALERQTAALRSFLVGSEAPLFSGATPAGDTLSLESLRGQYVLLDFWASWCGPCRRENPNVVRVYEKYRDAGFEILGISLDDRRERWLQAIEADALTWRHVSDLKGWRSEHAQLYGVTSIPQTVLLDPDGNIVARNLRGADLERKLRELLGAK
ncbi:TlpA family protein disulfide reductase [Lewinella sp. IMCC34183]|uniref:TlpA family protein disulfide reductase n=1 Tax=Lewinella sp. IMCC34183 TaxID=2248762 RepID=UPI0018E57ABB|nr:TlpA disulfide reductase family protein [Lewinella sp. IMCC34183]